mmetsp:Transcript_58448/g.162978  ORF Transcript_58448/g.162978 Transcript_58448/m.162978 type:complete len:86 (+) Transcript_58448:1077-1334(+)
MPDPSRPTHPDQERSASATLFSTEPRFDPAGDTSPPVLTRGEARGEALGELHVRLWIDVEDEDEAKAIQGTHGMGRSSPAWHLPS